MDHAKAPSGDPLALLLERRSVPAKQLDAPGPDDATLLRMLAAASRVPDHGKLVPFRFIRIQGDDRLAFGERLAARTLARDPDASPGAVEKDRSRFAHAPLVVTVVARLQPASKVPVQEQWATASSACFALLQAAQGLGFGAQWLTAWLAYDAEVDRWLGLGPDEHVAGFIHIGTPRQASPDRERPDPAGLLTDWRAGA